MMLWLCEHQQIYGFQWSFVPLMKTPRSIISCGLGSTTETTEEERVLDNLEPYHFFIERSYHHDLQKSKDLKGHHAVVVQASRKSGVDLQHCPLTLLILLLKCCLYIGSTIHNFPLIF